LPESSLKTPLAWINYEITTSYPLFFAVGYKKAGCTRAFGSLPLVLPCTPVDFDEPNAEGL
jgi:hypothetical protein